MKLLRKQEISEIKKDTKIKLNVLNNKMMYLKKLKFELEHGTLKSRYFKKSDSCKDNKIMISS